MRRLLLISIASMIIAVATAHVVHAQSPTPNIATQAVCTHSSGGSTTYAPSNYNDGIIAAPGSLPWGWSSGDNSSGLNAWIMFEWPAPVTFGEITFYYGGINNRYLAGATVQYWDDATSAWIDCYSYLFQAPYTDWIKVISFGPVTTARLRITNWNMAPVGQESNPNFREIEIRNVCTDPPTIVALEAPATVSQPGDIPLKYHIERLYGEFLATITFRFFTPSGTLVHTESTQVPFTGTAIDAVYSISSTTLPPGFYRLETTFNVFDICNSLSDMTINKVIMVVAAGQTACEVWPGDANNDGVVNFGDRKALGSYIHDANLNSGWLLGPARYRADAARDPLTFVRWEMQPGVPWITPNGCYMDCDGNGRVDNFDYIVMKMNWMRAHGGGETKTGDQANDASFDMNQNFPNPFNPSTQIQFSVPEESNVSIAVYDMNGRTVATLADGIYKSGIHSVTFNANGLGSGAYIATATMRATASGIEFTKTIRMNLSK